MHVYAVIVKRWCNLLAQYANNDNDDEDALNELVDSACMYKSLLLIYRATTDIAAA